MKKHKKNESTPKKIGGECKINIKNTILNLKKR